MDLKSSAHNVDWDTYCKDPIVIARLFSSVQQIYGERFSSSNVLIFTLRLRGSGLLIILNLFIIKYSHIIIQAITYQNPATFSLTQ